MRQIRYVELLVSRVKTLLAACVAIMRTVFINNLV